MNADDDVTVGIYLPTRNRAGLLPRAVTSVLNQSHRQLELIIVDDGSDDSTPTVIAELIARDSRVRALRMPTPVGAPAARNAAIRASAAQWLTGIDAEPQHEEVLMARSVWRRQGTTPARLGVRRLEAMLEQFQPRRRPLPTPLGGVSLR